MDPAIAAWIEEASTPDYWAALNPSLGMAGARVPPAFPIDDDLRNALFNDLLVDGYFHLGPRLPSDHVARMAQGVLRLAEARIPPVFLFVYDDPFQLSGYVAPLLETILGPGFLVLPNLWAWCVSSSPAGDGQGWGPHRDSNFSTLDEHGLPRTLTVWVPLTDATPMNGCIYCVPTSRDPLWRARSVDTTVRGLQTIRALPAPAGSVLGWNHTLLHWGGRAADGAPARVSFSVEYQRGDLPPVNRPVVPSAAPPPFATRMGLVAMQLRQYRHMSTMGEDWGVVADELSRRFPL